MDLKNPHSPPRTFDPAMIATPSPTDGEPADVVASDPLDTLLKQIIGGWFLLTDGQGAVSKWSEPAELLFGKEAPDALGHSFFEGLLAGPLSADAEQWRRFLTAGDPPRARALVELEGRHAPTLQSFPLEAVFIPVKLDEGFDFSLFLEDLAFELPTNLMLLRMRQQHPVVVRALRIALDAEPQTWEGGRTAGTMVAFRPLAPTPWVEDELVRRAQDRARQDAERQEAITNSDPGVQGVAVSDLEDAAAVVARLLSALDRIDELERIAGRLPAAVEEALREAQASRARAEGAEREARHARAELERLDAAPSAASEAERVELLARLERLERDRAEAAASSEARLAAALAEAGETRVEIERRLDELETAGGDALSATRAGLDADLDRLRADRTRDLETRRDELERIERERDEAAAARDELGSALERVERQHDREIEDTRAELTAALERIDSLHRDAERLHERVGDVTAERHEGDALAGDDRRRLEELQREGEQARAGLDALRTIAEQLREESVRGAETTHALRAELDAVRRGEYEARADVDALRAELSAARETDHRGLADLHAVRGAVDALADRVPAHDELDALRGRLEAFAPLEDLDVLRTTVDGLQERLDAARAEAAAARERADASAAAADLARAAASDTADRVAEVDRGAGTVLAEVKAAGDRLDEVAGLARAAQEAAGSGRAEQEELRAAVAHLGGEVQGARQRFDESAHEALSAREQSAAELLGELGAVRELAEQAGSGVSELRALVEALQADTAGVRTQADLANAVAERARATADEAKLEDEKVEALQAEVKFVLTTMEEMKTGLTSAGQAALAARGELEAVRTAAQSAGDGMSHDVSAVFREILGLAAKSRPRPLQKPVEEPARVAREPRDGFDDQSVPMAVIGTDGKFKECNPSFCRLVGYQEHEFGKAVWPSPHDRQFYAQQQEEFSALISGALESVPVQSTYLHGQGLMVPVIGEITAVRGDDGLPSHLLLRAEERETGH